MDICLVNFCNCILRLCTIHKILWQGASPFKYQFCWEVPLLVLALSLDFYFTVSLILGKHLLFTFSVSLFARIIPLNFLFWEMKHLNPHMQLCVFSGGCDTGLQSVFPAGISSVRWLLPWLQGSHIDTCLPQGVHKHYGLCLTSGSSEEVILICLMHVKGVQGWGSTEWEPCVLLTSEDSTGL